MGLFSQATPFPVAYCEGLWLWSIVLVTIFIKAKIEKGKKVTKEWREKVRKILYEKMN
jgi:hypothetical protein